MKKEIKEKKAIDIFNTEKNDEVVYQALRWFLASKRQGTHSTLTRAEVSGGGKKPWKQKGTGRARAGTIRSPLWRHGGVTFGPKPRDYSFALPIKVRKLALRIVLSDRSKNNALEIVDALDVSTPKTKSMAEVVKKLKLDDKKGMIILDKVSKNMELASRNIKKLKVIPYGSLNIYDLLNSEFVVITKAAVSGLKEMLS